MRSLGTLLQAATTVALPFVVACAGQTTIASHAREREELGLSYFRAESVDGNCSVEPAHDGEALANYVSRVRPLANADLDCVRGAIADRSPRMGETSAYYVYQTFLLLRDENSFLLSQSIALILKYTGIGNAPISAQVLYVASTLYGAKGLNACDRELAEAATEIGGLRYAGEVNEAARVTTPAGNERSCDDTSALRLLERARHSPRT